MTEANPFQEFISEDEEDDVVAVCVECFSEMPDSMAENDPFLNAGQPASCRFCGGPVYVASRSSIPAMRRKKEQAQIV